MNFKSFKLGLAAINSQLPYGKKPTEDELMFLWSILPSRVTDEISEQMWLYACQQRLLDPEPNDKLPVFQQVLRYLYRLRDGVPAYDWGLRDDLPQRLANAHSFQPLEAQPIAPAPQKALGGVPAAPERSESPEARRRRLLALAAATGVDISRPDGNSAEVSHG